MRVNLSTPKKGKRRLGAHLLNPVSAELLDDARQDLGNDEADDERQHHLCDPYDCVCHDISSFVGFIKGGVFYA